MNTIQVAIHDPEYADSIRNLLFQDGAHQVHLVEKPDLSLDGVIVVDTAHLSALPQLRKDRERLVVLARKDSDDLSKLWAAGIRHVVFQGDPPQMARTIVLSVEFTLVDHFRR